MRTLLRVSMDTEKSNDAIKTGSFPDVIRDTVARLQPEASYFYADQGKRTALFVFDLNDSSQIPVIAEPFFMEACATVEFFPAMNLEDLKSGLQMAATEHNRVLA
jgi:hypothetical protein